jgi:hypothetical protein
MRIIEKLILELVAPTEKKFLKVMWRELGSRREKSLW